MMVRLIAMACAMSTVNAALALAADEPVKPSTCAQVRSIDQWAVIDDRTAIIWTADNRRFKVTFTTSCRDMKHAHFAEIARKASSGLCLSPGDDIVFGRKHPKMRNDEPQEEQRCMIKTIEPMPEETPAAPANH
jgi:hypothetical protein